MEFITGVLLMAVVWLAVDKFKKPKVKEMQELTVEQKTRLKEEESHFEHMMNYDIKKAYGGK